MIDASKPDVGLVDVLAGEEIVTNANRAFARTIGGRPEVQDILRDGMDTISGDAIAREGVANVFSGIRWIDAGGGVVVDDVQAALRIERPAEIASLLLGSGDGGQELVGGAGANAFIVDE